MRFLFLIFTLIAAPLRAEPLRVVTTITPLYGIVSDLMRGIAEPVLIVTKGSDPHHFSLRPSQISTLLEADVIFAMGAGMEPWLDQIDLRPDTKVIYLANDFATETPLLPHILGLSVRNLDKISAESQPATADSIDPHVWLDEFNANLLIVGAIYALSPDRIDRSLEQQIMQNYTDIAINLHKANQRLIEIAQALGDTPIVTTHDSLQYLEHSIGINIVGALTSITGEQAGARSMGLLSRIEGPVCLLIDTSETSPDYAALFPDWTHVRYDPMGYEFAGQPDYLSNLYLSIAAALEACIPVT